MLKIIRERKKSLRVPMIIFVAVVSISLVGFFANWGAAPPSDADLGDDEMGEVLQHQIANTEEMVREYEEDLEENPGDIELVKNLAGVKYQLAYFYSTQGDVESTENAYRDCIELYQRVLQEEPDNFDAIYYLAVSASQVGENEIADENFEKAMGLDDENPYLLANYGVHLIIAEEDYETARKHFQRGLELVDPEDEDLIERLEMYISLTEGDLADEEN